MAAAIVATSVGYLVPTTSDLLVPGEDVCRTFFDDDLVGMTATDDMIRPEDDLVWSGPVGEYAGVWFPVTTIAAEVVAKADQWRRQRRIPANRWPPWM